MLLRFSAPPISHDILRDVRWRSGMIALAALAAVGTLMISVAVLLTARVPPPAPMPFSTGLRETTPSGTIGMFLLSFQSWFYQSIVATLKRIAGTQGGVRSLFGLCFAYGVFHAAGPGHGKAIIAGYVFADGQSAHRGVLLSIGAAFMQTLVAVGIISIFAIALHGTAALVAGVSTKIELASFVVVALLGLRLTWGNAAGLARKMEAWRLDDMSELDWQPGGTIAPGSGPIRHVIQDDRCACGDSHIITADHVAAAASGWREAVGVVLAAGLRPCSGVILLLVFVLSQQLYVVGILAASAVALGTAMTTSVFAVFASVARRLLAGISRVPAMSRLGATLLPAAEILAGAVVFWLGITLVIGLWSSSGG